MQSLITQILTSIVGEDIDEEMLEYMIKIRHEEDLEEFLSNMFDIDKPEYKNALEQLKDIIIGTDPRFRKGWNPSVNVPQNSRVRNEVFVTPLHINKVKKPTYIALDTYTYTPVLKKGRHPCDCEARAHGLVNNCLNCGRIVCEQEGSGPCFFCDNMVVTKEEQEVLNSNTKESDKLYNRLHEQKKSKEWKKAIEARNKLLRADRMGEMKNTIYDDQTDYFIIRSPNDDNKNTPTSTGQMKLALNLATKTVNCDIDPDEFNINKQTLMFSLNKLLDFKVDRLPKALFDDNPKAKEDLIRIYGEVKDTDELIDKIENSGREPPPPPPKEMPTNRIASKDLILNLDKGMCLSMHQPWASLLVSGIKKHEGRSWRTDHRGRLWIHAASKQPTEIEILACEEFYKKYYNDPALTIPKKYPTSCILGCVHVDNCLAQKEYREKYPDGESDSPYVLICSRPAVLCVYLPMHGQHKIFRLGTEIHHHAKEALRASVKIGQM